MINHMPSKTPSSPIGNLSDVAYLARAAIKYGAFFIVFIMIGRIVLNMSVSLYKALNPPKPPGPTYGFGGTLPELTFPSSKYEVKSYTLQTKDGSLPNLGDQLPVYFMPVSKVNLFSLDRAKQIAATLGFVFPPEQVSTTVYRWKRTTPLPSVLEIDIVSEKFTMKTDWASDPNFLVNKTLPPQNSAINEIRNTLNSAGLLDRDIATGEARVSFLKASGSTYTSAVSFSEADFIQIDIFRFAIQNKYPVFRSDPSLGNARAIFSGSPVKEQRIVEMEFAHLPIEYDRFETYGLISTLDAWKALQAGKGYVAYLDTNISDVVIRNVALAYYDADDAQNYLQPIYVFTGDNNFFGYVPAVAPYSQFKR